MLDWCASHATQRPLEVLAVGLAYLYGLNEHMLRAATFVEASTPTLQYPLARRERGLADAERAELVLDTPEWLSAAAAAVLAPPGRKGRFVFPGRSRTGMASAGYIRSLVSTGGAAATGFRISCATLVSTRTADIDEAKLPLALYGIGYAPRYIARLIRPQVSVIIPRKAS